MNILVRSTLREIKTSITRYLAIFAITALGVGFFSGLKICKADMTKTAGDYLEAHNMYDYMLTTSYGVDDESVGIAESEEGVSGAEGSVQIDVMAAAEDGSEKAFRAISLPEHINTLELVSGRMPEGPDECVINDYSMEGGGFRTGDRIRLSDSNDAAGLVSFRTREFTVVGTVCSPIFLDYQRGSTDIGNGSLDSFFYIDRSVFDVDYYTRLYLTLDGDESFFTDEKEKRTDSEKERMEALAERIAEARRETVMTEIRDELSSPLGILMDYLVLPVYEDERDEAAGRLREIEAELAGSTGSEKEALEKERDEAYRELRKTEKKIAGAGSMLDYAQRGLGGDDTGDSYAVSVYQDPGYASFDNNSDIVSNVAKIFPVFFFLIAALVCMTTMTRMIDEQRSQIGLFKALGYSNAFIAGKYMFYSCSASFLGAVTGFIIGCRVFPFVIWRAYGMMYGFCDELEYVFDLKLGLIALACALVCSAGATWASLSQDFRVAPSELIRPKTPPAGKRILLERITPLWDRISFLYKVSIRNVFRDKKRFLMMVAGVSGCTALLVAGMGIGTSIAGIADHQFDEISLFDYRVIFSSDMSSAMQQDFVKYMADKGVSEDEIRFVHQDEVTLLQDGEETDVTCIAADGDGFGKFIDLHRDGDPVGFPGDGAVIVKNISREYGLGTGDSIKLRAGGRERDLKVSGICDNYMYDTVYLSRKTYEDVFGRKPEIRSALVRLDEGDEEKIRETATAAANYGDAAAVTVNLDIRNGIAKMMRSLDLVTIIIILSAALLAFVVIYNLTSINITERIREIATIKVLGFYPVEVAQYVFRENIFMTAVAAAAGIPLGKWLLNFALKNVTLKMLYFEARLTGIDILKAVALTFVFSFLVNLAMQRRLDKVNMTESLKSTE